MLPYIILGISLYMGMNGHSKEKITNINAYWYEESRGNSKYKKYPPCYDLCGATRKIFDILDKMNMINDYYILLNVYSVILCQEKYCRKNMLLERLRDLKNSGGNELDREAQQIVRQYAKLQNNEIGFLLVLATSIIIRELHKLVNDNRISNQDKHNIFNLNNTFYATHYDKLTQACHFQ